MRLSQASTTNVALKRQRFSERSATTILLFDLVKTYGCRSSEHGNIEIPKEATDVRYR